MPKERNENDGLSTNQEYTVAFLVIALFGLMYWFFMHGNDENLLSKTEVVSPKVTSVSADKINTDAKDRLAAKKSKQAEVQARRDAAIALEQKNAEDSQKTKLLSDVSSNEETLKSELLAQKEKLANEISLKQEALKSAESDKQKAIEILENKLTEANDLLTAERSKAEEAIKNLAALKQQGEKQAALNNSNVADLNSNKESMQAKLSALTLQLSSTKASLEAERAKVASITEEFDTFKALKAKQDKLNESNANRLLASTEQSLSNEAEAIANKLAEAKKVAEAERLKAEETATMLAQIKASKEKQQAADAEKAKRLAESIEKERLKADKIAKKLVEMKQVINAEREKAEAERLKAEQELAEMKRLSEAEKAEKLAAQKQELEARIRVAQEALAQQERNRFSFSLANGKVVQIAPNSFEDKLRASILDGASDNALILDKVFFASGSSSLNRVSRNQIEGIAAILETYDNTKVLIRGHTDSTGDESLNMALSLNRSKQIKNQLVLLGINSERISVEGKGSQEPVADNATQAGRRENRRIDLLLQ